MHNVSLNEAQSPLLPMRTSQFSVDGLQEEGSSKEQKSAARPQSVILSILSATKPQRMATTGAELGTTKEIKNFNETVGLAAESEKSDGIGSPGR